MTGKPSPETPTPSAEFPDARVASSRWAFLQGATVLWVLAGVSVVTALTLTVQAWRAPGPQVTVTFEQGYGVAPGDPVRLRGTDVGEVSSVTMAKSLNQVKIVLRLTQEAAGLAREGTQFWIQRPQVSLAAVRGLETLVGPKYVAVQPGDPNGASKRFFQGVELPRQISSARRLAITVRFRQGYGLTPGAPLRFRGVQVGEVVDVDLDQELGHVLVHAELKPAAERLARSGSRFWVERPQVGVAQMRGLDTLIGGRYLAVAPGHLEGEPQQMFEGSDEAPAETDATGGIEVVLASSSRHGLKAGSPVIYRGVTVGHVVRVGLSSDGTEVESRVFIRSAFRRLVRDNTRFGSNSGLGMRFGLTGVQLDAESLETIAAGGVALATPDKAGKRVATGHRFPLEEKFDVEWLDWRPPIIIGRTMLPEGVHAPTPVRASLQWKRRRFGLLRDEHRHTWAHVLDGHRLLCPLAGELPEELTLEIEGESLQISKSKVIQIGLLAVIDSIAPPKPQDVWSRSRLRSPKDPEDCVLLAGPDSLPVSAGRIRRIEKDDAWQSWRVDISIELTADWHGASVVAQKDGALIGALQWDDGHAVILPLPKELLE